MALSELRRLRSKEEQINRLARAKVVEAERLTAEERSHAFEARIAASACLLRLKRVHKKVRLKEYRLVKQGLLELEANKRGSTQFVMEINPSSLAVESLMALRSPLTNSFFNLSFFLLLNLNFF